MFARKRDLDRAVGDLQGRFDRLEKRLAKPAGASAADRAGTKVGQLDFEAAPIYLSLDSRYSVSRLRSCAKEPWTVGWLESSLEPGDVLYDIGANVGAFALIGASLANRETQVYAFEPGYATYATLCDNVQLNEATNLHPLPVALYDETGLSSFDLRDVAPGAGMHFMGGGDSPWISDESVFSQPVIAWRLDELVAKANLPAPNHIKIDVDGLEPRVLRGAGELLAGEGLRSVMIEMEPGQAEEITSLLEGHGLPLAEKFKREVEGPGDPPTYGLFRRSA